MNSVINCPNNADCYFNGTLHEKDYFNSIINCGMNGWCYFWPTYDDDTSQGVHQFDIFNATLSKYVEIKKSGRVVPQSNEFTSTIYCPIAHGDAREDKFTCLLECGCEKSRSSCDNLEIYAKQGFLNFNISEPKEDPCKLQDVTMYCASLDYKGNSPDSYDVPCAIEENYPNECSDDDETEYNGTHTCDWYTDTPTMSPSSFPS